MLNLGFDLFVFCLIVVNIEEKEYYFIVCEYLIVGKFILLFENGKEYGLIDK